MSNQSFPISTEAVALFCVQNHICRLSLFGSALRQDFGPDSDIDVLVEFEKGTRTGLRFFELQDELSRILGRPVDLNTLGFLGKHIRDRVIADAQVIYDAR